MLAINPIPYDDLYEGHYDDDDDDLYNCNIFVLYALFERFFINFNSAM